MRALSAPALALLGPLGQVEVVPGAVRGSGRAGAAAGSAASAGRGRERLSLTDRHHLRIKLICFIHIIYFRGPLFLELLQLFLIGVDIIKLFNSFRCTWFMTRFLVGCAQLLLAPEEFCLCALLLEAPKVNLIQRTVKIGL